MELINQVHLQKQKQSKMITNRIQTQKYIYLNLNCPSGQNRLKNKTLLKIFFNKQFKIKKIQIVIQVYR